MPKIHRKFFYFSAPVIFLSGVATSSVAAAEDDWSDFAMSMISLPSLNQVPDRPKEWCGGGMWDCFLDIWWRDPRDQPCQLDCIQSWQKADKAQAEQKKKALPKKK